MMTYQLITGKSGFLGRIISEELDLIYPNLRSLGRSSIDDFKCDLLSGEINLTNSFDIVIHSAGKAHRVPKSSTERQAFFDINVGGTKKLLSALSSAPTLPKSFVFISSVAVYGTESGLDINEDYTLAAKDPYGRSKIQAEEVVRKWCESNQVICTILRLPLLIGSNPPGNLKTMIKAIKKGYYFNIAGGGAKKSMVLANDVARIIPKVALIGGVYNLTDGYHPSFAELAQNISEQLGKPKALNVPLFLANIMAKIGDLIGSKALINTIKLKKITSDLIFNDSKARQLLKWNPTPVLKGFKV